MVYSWAEKEETVEDLASQVSCHHRINIFIEAKPLYDKKAVGFGGVFALQNIRSYCMMYGRFC
jgi:hypothetical protein